MADVARPGLYRGSWLTHFRPNGNSFRCSIIIIVLTIGADFMVGKGLSPPRPKSCGGKGPHRNFVMSVTNLSLYK